VPGHALLIDCGTLAWTPVPVPEDVDVLVVDSGERRRLAGSAYATRRAEVEAAVGPGLRDPVLRRRARHVATENERVAAFADALRSGDVAAAGALMGDSHASLRDDFEVSTPALDVLVARLAATPGVLGARLTGAGFGGCAVALARPGTVVPADRWWRVRPAGGAHVTGR
jgi:galactokinase